MSFSFPHTKHGEYFHVAFPLPTLVDDKLLHIVLPVKRANGILSILSPCSV